MLDAQGFRDLYALLDVGQTVDDEGDPIDCGGPCDKFCCKPGNTTKYLLPGERPFLEAALAERGDAPFVFQSVIYFESLKEPTTRKCACEPLRELRPFNCRVFPFSPRIDVAKRRVTAVGKSSLAYLAACWISEPAPRWRDRAVQAWQRVLDDDDCRMHFARLCTLWEWNQAVERGDEPGHALAALAALKQAGEAEQWERCRRFFTRSDIEPARQM